jgi:hypothetical protein
VKYAFALSLLPKIAVPFHAWGKYMYLFIVFYDAIVVEVSYIIFCYIIKCAVDIFMMFILRVDECLNEKGFRLY